MVTLGLTADLGPVAEPEVIRRVVSEGAGLVAWRLGMRSAAFAICLVGCTSSGSLELDLSLPSDPDLRPTGMTSISVLATFPAPTDGSTPIGSLTNTSLLNNSQSFSAEDLPVGDNIQIDVLFRDVSSGLVGVGEAAQLVNISGDKTSTLSIPVRRPFVYASSGSTLYSFDPTLDPRATKFQGQLAGLTSPQLAISVGGDRLVIASASPNQLQIVDTATHMVTGAPLAIPGAIHDAAPIPGTNRVAVAHATGITIVDLDTMTITTATGPSVDRITVGGTTDGHVLAYGLVGRVAPPAGPTDPCTGSSSLVTVDVDAPTTLTPMALNQAVADIAASPDAAMLFAALPCTNQVSRLDGATFTNVSSLERAAVLTVADQRIWAAGSHASTPSCTNASGTEVACTATSTADCSATTGTMVNYVTAGAHLIVQSIPIEGGTAISIDVPEQRETMVSTDDPAGQHAQVLRSLAMTPLDLVTLPGGQYVGLVTSSTYFITSLVDGGTGTVILPCLKTTTGDWLLMDMASSTEAQRVRTQCNLMIGPHPPGTVFPGWTCENAPDGQNPTLGQYQPISVGALFGAR